MTRNTSRPGVTLLEVLTAIFITGVGLLAILTLFPLGALSMARAVRDDRAAAIGANASSQAIAMDLRNDPNVAGLLAGAPAGLAVAPDGPGYPVYVDPQYAILPGGTVLGAAGGGAVPTPGVTRVRPSFVTNSTAVARWFVFQDEITFQKNGTPSGSAGVNVTRPGTYSYAYLLRRPRQSSPAFTELSVVVYASRPSDSVQGEAVTTTSNNNPLGYQGANTVLVGYPGGASDKPNIRKGGWILDTSYRPVGTGGTVNAYFYQVAKVEDNTAANVMTLTLETPLKENVTTLVVMENVITVLDRGTAWRP